MNSPKKQARRAGILYILANLPAPFAIIYLPNLLIVPGNPTATADHVRASIGLIRAGMAVELLNATIIVFAALAFYRLFASTSARHARAMLVLILLAVPISLLNVLNYVAVLSFARGGYLSVFDQQQLDALVLFFLRLHSVGYVIAGIFWGLWLLPFGILAMRSGFIPWLIGLFMLLAGIPYVLSALTTLVLPQYDFISTWLSPLMAGELPMVVWLLVWGAKQPANENLVPTAAVA